MTEGHVNDDKIVDVLHIFSDASFVEALFQGCMYDDVASRTVADLVYDVFVKCVLTICPFDFDLNDVSMYAARQELC